MSVDSGHNLRNRKDRRKHDKRKAANNAENRRREATGYGRRRNADDGTPCLNGFYGFGFHKVR